MNSFIKTKLQKIQGENGSQIDMNILSNDEILELILNYEGIQGYTNYIKNLIQGIYNVELK